MIALLCQRRPRAATPLWPYTTLFRSRALAPAAGALPGGGGGRPRAAAPEARRLVLRRAPRHRAPRRGRARARVRPEPRRQGARLRLPGRVVPARGRRVRVVLPARRRVPAGPRGRGAPLAAAAPRGRVPRAVLPLPAARLVRRAADRGRGGGGRGVALAREP